MDSVFLSYGRADFFFVQLAQLKLEQAGIRVWADTLSLRPGDDWKLEIDRGIDSSTALIVLLSPDAMQSSYVTYEWASAMGKGKPIVPVLVADCQRHPKIEAIQHVDFSNPTSQPWEILEERIREVLAQAERPEDDYDSGPGAPPVVAQAGAADTFEPVASQIIGYLDRRGFRMMSFERVRSSINSELSDEWLAELVRNRPDVFRIARIKGGKKGLARR